VILNTVAELGLNILPTATLFTEFMQEEFEDTIGVIIIRKSRKNRQHNGQKKMHKRTNSDL
jgi:hypothetical protein